MPDKSILTEFALGSALFSANIYKELLKTSTENLLVCPLSLQIILALTHAGAKGKTAEQLSDALHLPKTEEKIKKTFKELNSYFHNNRFTLSSANKIYIKDGFKITDQFNKTAVEDFFAEIQNVDFEQKQETAAIINKWVAENTKEKIKDIIKADELEKGVCAILVNALYFHGVWSEVFDKGCTKKQPFYLNNEDHIDVDMMKQKTYADYYEDSNLDAKFLVMRYEGWLASMTFVLPNARDGLDELEGHISKILEKRYYSNEKIMIAIPKFKIENSIKFVPILEALGIVDAFQDTADLSGIIQNKPLKINEVKQKTYIDVHEDGTTAAAVTVVEAIVGCCRKPPKPKQFIADHPFIFILKIEDVVLFLGRCIEPKY